MQVEGLEPRHLFTRITCSCLHGSRAMTRPTCSRSNMRVRVAHRPASRARVHDWCKFAFSTLETEASLNVLYFTYVRLRQSCACARGCRIRSLHVLQVRVVDSRRGPTPTSPAADALNSRPTNSGSRPCHQKGDCIHRRRKLPYPKQNQRTR